MVVNIIFDLDGTLIDTEKYYRKAWPMALAHFGYEMSDARSLQMRSLGRPHSPRQLREWYGQDFDYPAVREYRKQLIEDMIAKDGMDLKPGAVETLTKLRDMGYTVAMATANEYDRAERYLKKIGLFEYFDKIICANMVESGKPAPDIYSYACSELGADASECYAVEDSPNGVKSAFLAGCKVIFVPDQTDVDDEIRDMIYARVDSLTDIISLVAKG
ncbi:MAG: HAD family phosphatase [Lachnospiraceae bacterium]|nr:HAD family phosphatase [Candidatus Merdinaster equi]